MVAQNLLRQTKKIVYRLKRQYGLRMSIKYMSASDQYDLETGVVTRTLAEITIRRGILLPQKVIREFSYDLSFIAANKNFTYGGFYQRGQRWVIIDSKDLPTDFAINGEMYIVFNSRRYEIKEHDKIPDGLVKGYAWLLKVEQVTSSDDDS